MKRILQTMKQDGMWWPMFGAALAVTMIAFSGPGFAAKGGIPGPPVGGETANNLSTPSIQTESANTIEANWAVPAPATRGVHFSYGCDVPETNGQFSYPNTSCVDNLDDPNVYNDAAECTAAGMPCDGLPVSRIYWQKVDVNEWWADDDGIFGQVPDFADVAYIDWGDALEAVSWNERAVIRVETQPWGNRIPGFDPTLGATCADSTLDPEADCKTGFQMWHVSGQGITEHWGVRASDEDPGQPFAYESPFQIIKTTEARLNLTKMAAGDALCSQPGGNPGDEAPDVGNWIVDAEGKGHWEGTCTWSDAPYSVETSVGGKYVYGYNWRMKNVDLTTLCPGWVKTGFWRLTFYAPNDVVFSDGSIPTVAPPAVPAVDPNAPEAALAAVVMSSEDEDPDADDRLYIPFVDTTNNLTHLDICIVAKTEGGGGGGGGQGGGDIVDDAAKPGIGKGRGKGGGKKK
mgnify:CR=1 FL=1